MEQLCIINKIKFNLLKNKFDKFNKSNKFNRFNRFNKLFFNKLHAHQLK